MFRNLDRYDLLTFIVGLLFVVKVKVIGVFSISEFFLLFMTICTNTSQYKENQYARTIIRMAILWCVGIIISGVYNNAPIINTMKGLFFVLVMVFIIPACYKLLCDKPKRIVYFYLGYGIGALFAPYFAADEEFAERLASQVYVYYSVSYLVHGIGYLIYMRGYRKVGILVCYGIAIAGLFYMARSPFLAGTVAVIMLLFVGKKEIPNIDYSIIRYRQKIPLLFVAVMLSAYAAGSAYEYFAANGALGADAQAKYYAQKLSGGSSLEGGRMETFMGMELITKNPIIGYGSYAVDKGDKVRMQYAVKHKTDYLYTRAEDRQLPSHSYIVGAWVQNGILGALFWIYILFLLWRILISGYLLNEPRLLCLLFFQICAMLWDIFFSPFSDRVQTVFFLMLMIIIYDNSHKGLYLVNNENS